MSKKKNNWLNAITLAFVCCASPSLALAVPVIDSGYGLYLSSQHPLYERVAFLAPNITGLNNRWVNCPPDFTRWLPYVAYGGSPGGYIWYGCTGSSGDLPDVAIDSMRDLMLGDFERSQNPWYLNGNYTARFHLDGGTLFGRAYQTAFPQEENLGRADEGDPTTCEDSPQGDDALGTPDSAESVGNPVRAGVGNKLQIEFDYRCAGPARLAFHRYYNSASTSAGPWGASWSADYFQKIRILTTVSTAVFVGRPSGRSYAFRRDATGWMAVSSTVTERLDEIVSNGIRMGWVFHTRTDATESYDVSGRLLSITYRDGLITTLVYDDQSRLIYVQGPVGHRLTFRHNESSRVIAMTDPAGGNFAYDYDSNNNLIAVTYPDAASKRYHYEEAAIAFANALTGVTDESGIRFATYSYVDSPSATGATAGRPVRTSHADGANQYAVQYSSTTLFNWDSATITDPLGVTRTYTFGTFGGRRRVVSIAGLPCPACGPRAASYDANGYPTATTDWNGNLTTYARNDPGGRPELETERREALGTSAVRTVTTQWHPTLRIPVKIAEPKRITTLTYDEHGNVTSRSIQPTNDTSGTQGLSAAPIGQPRVWTWAYVYSVTVPGLIQRITADGPRTDVTDVTIYQYYPGDATCAPSAADASTIGCRGQLESIANAAGHLLRFTRTACMDWPSRRSIQTGSPPR